MSVWFGPELADEIMKNNDIMDDIPNIIIDIVSGRLDITHLVENMGGVLTNTEVTNREMGMKFFTQLLKDFPDDYLTAMQVKFISKFYTDRLNDNHVIVPRVLEGYLAIIKMKNYNINNSGEFLTVLFREVPCQSQVRQDRYKIFLIIKMLLEKDVEYIKALGPDFVYGVMSAMDGERDPRNLMFLFGFLPTFLKHIPLGHLTEEMFEVISCYYPIDFHPSPEDPAAVTRQDLATALAPCLCGTQAFGELCLVLLIEKLDSSLRLAKIDSLKLLTESCKSFNAETYGPFLKSLWSSIHKEILHKTDNELRMAAHEALSALVAKLATTANTDQAFETFIKGILISVQTAVAEAKTVIQFVQTTKILLTTANASKESCIIITKSMIPAIIAYYDFKTSPKLQIASLDFLGDLYELAQHWEVLNEIEPQTKDLPQLCLMAVSKQSKEYQIAGFKTLIRCKNVLETELIVPFVEVLIHNIQYCQDDDLLKISVETVHTIARKFPEMIMSLVVIGKCDLDNLTKDNIALEKRLNLLSNLASIDDFTKVIIEEMLKLISNNQEASKVVEALSESLSNSNLYTDAKLTQIESDHGIIDSVMNWLLKELENEEETEVSHAYILITNTISSLPIPKQINILDKHTENILELCKRETKYFLVLECLYSSLQKDLYYDKIEDILKLSLKQALYSFNDAVSKKACALTAHFLNKAEHGPKFELLYEILKTYLSKCKKDNESLCPKLIYMYGWITKGLILRGSDLFLFWLQKIVITLANPEYCNLAADSIALIMTDNPDYLTPKQHCRISLLYKQRMFQNFNKLTEKFEATDETKEAYLLSWALVLEKAPRSVLNSDSVKICSIVIDSLEYENKTLLLAMIDVLCYYVQTKHASIGDSIQTILPRLINLSKYVQSMDVRIRSLQCIYDIANNYRTSLLLPFKQDILFDLIPSLDDKKRLVRNMAVKTRTRWFLIGAPGEPKDN